MPSTFGANLPARLFGDYNDVSFLVSGLRIPVGLGDLTQRIESISTCRSWAQGIGGSFPKPRLPIHHRFMMGADTGVPPTVSRREQFLSGSANQTLLAVSREPPDYSGRL
jgi:hypothetical protein